MDRKQKTQFAHAKGTFRSESDDRLISRMKFLDTVDSTAWSNQYTTEIIRDCYVSSKEGSDSRRKIPSGWLSLFHIFQAEFPAKTPYRQWHQFSQHACLPMRGQLLIPVVKSGLPEETSHRNFENRNQQIRYWHK